MVSTTAILRVLSFNIQVGISTHRPRHVVTRGWHHVLPSSSRDVQLGRIAATMSGFGIVGLQEADAGSIRTRGMDQVEYLAKLSGYENHSFLLNRNMWQVARHGIAVTSKHPPTRIEHHALPGRIKGRGVIFAIYGEGDEALCVAVTHLALSRNVRSLQMGWLAEQMSTYRHLIFMGDMNCEPIELQRSALSRIGLEVGSQDDLPMTYPSWRPKRSIDHVLTSESLPIRKVWVPEGARSDHLPLAAEVMLPESLHWLSSD